MSLPRLAASSALALTLLAGVACSSKNPNFCEGVDCDAIDAAIDSGPVSCSGNGPDPDCPADNPVCVAGACAGGCTSDADCAARPAGQRVCHVASGDCGACDEDDRQAEPGSAEDECPGANNAVCDADTHACRACAAHAECFSGVCDNPGPSGVCVAPANVIYMTPMAEGGTDGGSNDCLSPATGCLTLHYAIGKVTATRKYIVMKPSETAYPARNNTDRADFNAVTAHVLGEGAKVLRNGLGPIIEVRGGSNVTIEGLEVSNASGVGSGTGIVVADSTLDLYRVKVQNNAYRGVSASSSSTLRIRRSVFANNDGGGIFLDTGRFTIINNIIVGNGDILSSNFGGVNLNSAATDNIFEFNTVVSNSATTGTPDGVICTNPTLVARNNIVTGASGQARVSGSCMHTFSLFAPDGAPAGNGNMTVSDVNMFMFTSDFHIAAGSVAVGKAESTNLTGETLFDFDGDSRAPNGTSVEVGADEIP